MRIQFVPTTIKEAGNANINEMENYHAAPPADNNYTLQAILATVYTALRPHPEALPAVERALTKLLGPQSPTHNAKKPTTIDIR